MALSKEDIRKIKDAKGIDKLAEFAKANDIELTDDELEEVAGGCGGPRKTKVHCVFSNHGSEWIETCNYEGELDGLYNLDKIKNVECPKCEHKGYLIIDGYINN